VTAVLAWPDLFDRVVARFAAEGTAVPNVFGWRAAAVRDGVARRIVWEPGDDGDVGAIDAARSPGGNPRSLGTLGEMFAIYVESHDPAAAENERAQYVSARLLFDALWRALYIEAHGVVRLERLAWYGEPKTRRYGAALRGVFSLQASIPDVAYPVVPADTGALVASSLLDVTEDVIVKAPVEVATVAAITLSGLQTIDGVLLVPGDRVLVKDQAAPATNGIYTAALGAWSRSLDADTSGEMPSGLVVSVGWGSLHAGSRFLLSSPAPITLGSSALVFVLLIT